MAAPSGTVWGSIVNSKGRIGIYTSVTNTNTQTSVNVQVWFWTRYSCDDDFNNLYFNVGKSVTSASTLYGQHYNVDHKYNYSWDERNQTRLINKTYTYTRSTSAVKYNAYARFQDIDWISGKMYANTSYTVPALTSYTIKYNANGGSGAPSSQTKWYGKSLTLSSTKPTRTGHSFQGWATSSSGSVKYAAGASYTANSAVTLYAVWKANTYTVTFNANGGTGGPSSQTKTYGKTLTLSSTKPTRTNYTFQGWGTSASATAVSYAAGGSYTSNASITLYAVWKLTYVKPTINSMTVSRCNSSGTLTDSGTYALVKFDWTTSYSVSSIKIECASSDGTTTTTVSASGTSGSVSKVIGGSMSSEVTYTVRAIVADSNGSWTVSKTLHGTKFAFDAKSGGGGIAFGKAAELDDYAEFGFKSKHWKNSEFANNVTISGTDPNGNVKEVINPQNTNGNFVIGRGNYDNKSGSTYVYGYDILLGVSNIATPTTYRPYRRRGDSVTWTVKTAGYVTNSGTEVTFFVPFAMPIYGNPTVSVTSGSGFVLRQGNKYTHGSSASAYAMPTKYTASMYAYAGVFITATFSDTTNVVNNDSIGIVWNGTITFT